MSHIKHTAVQRQNVAILWAGDLSRVFSSYLHPKNELETSNQHTHTTLLGLCACAFIEQSEQNIV